jgi:hypothetical protein
MTEPARQEVDPDFLAGVTDIRLDFPVPTTRWAELSLTILQPDKPRVTHTLAVNGHPLPGQWVVMGARQDYDKDWRRQHWITMARLEDPA